MRSKLMLATAVIAGVCGTTLFAQKTTEVHPGKGGSPHVKTTWVIDGANISITYGRPYLKGRSEADVMPPGKPWRTGADEATILTTDKPLKFGSLSLQPGSYTLNTQPGTEWQLRVGKLGPKGEAQWGIPYQKDLEIGRVPMTVAKGTSVDQLTIGIDDTPKGGTLRIEWGTVRATAPFAVG